MNENCDTHEASIRFEIRLAILKLTVEMELQHRVAFAQARK